MHRDVITARLFLHAVLPSLSELVRHDPPSREAIRGINARLQFCIVGGPSVVLSIRDGAISSREGRDPFAGLIFSFVSASHLVRLFKEEKGFPILWKGFWNLSVLKAFMTLSKRLGHYTKLDPAVATAEEKNVLVPLLMEIALRGVAVLGSHDPHCERTVRGLINGTAEMRVLPDGPARAISHQTGRFEVSSPGGRQPDVVMNFKDHETALGLLTGRLDAMSALGLGDIVIRGNIFFFDGLSAIMARLDRYLK